MLRSKLNLMFLIIISTVIMPKIIPKSCQNDMFNETSCVDILSQNRVAERKSRHLHENVCALLF